MDAPPGRFRSVSVSKRHACAIRESGEIACWGRTESGETDAPAGRFRSVSAGAWHTCGVRESGEIACWGQYAIGVPGSLQ